MSILQTTDDVIRAFGGPTALGRLVGRNAQAVNHWRGARRGKFPPWTFLLIQAELKKFGHTAPANLWGLEEPIRRRA